MLTNGIKFTHQGGVSLKVNCNLEDPYHLIFEVEDTGKGIDEKELTSLFQPFFRVKSDYSQEGTGLGLSISRKYAQLMGGNITVRSQLAVGTIFKLEIVTEPVLEAEFNSINKKTSKIISLASNEKIYRILVVDDVSDNIKIVKELLNKIL